MAYVELHAHSAFSFLDGASLPEELAIAAVERGHTTLALTDHDTISGSMEFAVAARTFGLRAIHGCELTVEGDRHVTLLVRDEVMFGTGQLPKFRDDQFLVMDTKWREERLNEILKGLDRQVAETQKPPKAVVDALIESAPSEEMLWLVPTAATITYVGDTPEKIRSGPLKDLPPVSLEKVLKLGTQPRKLVKLAHQIGVGIALGTDAPLVPHGQNAAEMVEYVKAGMTPMEALMTGTVNAATAGGIKNAGRLEPGMAADIVAMSKSPLEDINSVMDVGFVMAGGLVVKSFGGSK